MADLLEPAPARKRTKDAGTNAVRPIPVKRDPHTEPRVRPATSTNKEEPTELRTGPWVGKTDAELVAVALKQDTEGYGELVARYQLEVRNLARSIVRDYQMAEDLAQEAFLKAYYNLADLKEPAKYGSWVCTILRHTALDHLRSSKNLLSLENLQEEGFEPERTVQDAAGAQMLEVHEDELRTVEALSKLREDYREIIILKHVEKLSYKEIAERLNMTVSAVGEKLSRVRSLLKRKLEKKQFRRQQLEDDE